MRRVPHHCRHALLYSPPPPAPPTHYFFSNYCPTVRSAAFPAQGSCPYFHCCASTRVNDTAGFKAQIASHRRRLQVFLVTFPEQAELRDFYSEKAGKSSLLAMDKAQRPVFPFLSFFLSENAWRCRPAVGYHRTCSAPHVRWWWWSQPAPRPLSPASLAQSPCTLRPKVALFSGRLGVRSPKLQVARRR